MTSPPSPDQTHSRHSSTTSAPPDGRDRPRQPLGPRTPQRSGSSRTHYSVTPASLTTATPAAADTVEPEAVPRSDAPPDVPDEPMPSSPPAPTSPTSPITSPTDAAAATMATPPSPQPSKPPGPPPLPPRILPPPPNRQPMAPEPVSATSPTGSTRAISPTTTARTNVGVMSAAQSEQSEPEVLPGYSRDGYRSPEAVIDHIEDSHGSLPPGIVEATWDDKWDSNDKWESKASHPERPQIGSGRLPLRLFQDIHSHQLIQPTIYNLPRPTRSPSASPTTTLQPLDRESPATPAITIEDVLDALPGGREQHGEWFFCPDCFGWYRIIVGSGDPPAYRGYDSRIPRPLPHETAEDELQAWGSENARLRDMALSRSTAPHSMAHFHTFDRLFDPHEEVRIPRVVVDGLVETFAHLDPGYGIVPSQLVDGDIGRDNCSKLHMSCSTDCWVLVSGPVGGQLPKAVAHEWTQEKRDNPTVGLDGVQSAIEGWQLVIRLLQNPLFLEKRGWVKMSNPKFFSAIGPSLRSQILMHRVGFSCKNSDDGYQLGPFAECDLITAAHVDQMYKYMLRAWVEITLFLQVFERAHNKPLTQNNIAYVTHGEVLGPVFQLDKIPKISTPWNPALKIALATLGVTDIDTAKTIDIAYDFQMSEDQAHAAAHLTALQELSGPDVPDVDTLRLKVALERSMDRFTLDDLETAYARIGLDHAHLKSIMVERKELPAEYVYERHREVMESASDSEQRMLISNALVMVGKDRGDSHMQSLGHDGGTHLSLEQAYREFDLAPDQFIDSEMLIMQYEGWIADRPSRKDQYRQALSVIANAPGQERPQIQAFLAGKDISEFQGPVRRDIPAGLRNIGNTCYLNSVLQFLYAVKPVRDAVLGFEQPPHEASPAEEDAKAMETWIKIQSSCRFVELLGKLFSQMYETEHAAVTPAEELARLAILPIDLIDQRRDAVPAANTRLTIEALPTIPQLGSPSSSGAATADTAPTTPVSTLSPTISSTGVSPQARPSPPPRRASVLGKRASEDRESAFGGSEERLRLMNRSSNTIEMDSPTPGTNSSPLDIGRDEDVEMQIEEPATRAGSELSPADAGLSGLGLTSPKDENAGPSTPKMETRNSGGLVTPDATPPSRDPPKLAVDTQADPPSYGPPPLPPRRRSMALVAAEKFGLQQDAAEILINVLSQLEYAFDRGEGGNLIKSLFSTKFRQQMWMDTGNGVTESHPPVESQFSHPIIGVEEDDKDLYDGLAELYLGGDEVDYDGKKGYKMDLLDELPPVLYILMRRSQYDFARNRQIKTNTHIKFGETLAMDRFMAGADSARREASIAITRKMMRMRARRHELRHHKPLSVPETFRLVRDAMRDDKFSSLLGDAAPSSRLLESLGLQADRTEEEIDRLGRELAAAKEALEATWADARDVEYELVSVFVHGGTGTGGHYWTYQAALPENGGKYFYYSDDNVKDVPSSDVFEDKSAQGVSPALLVYVRKGQGLVDTLHRKVAEEAAAEAAAGGGGEGGGEPGGTAAAVSDAASKPGPSPTTVQAPSMQREQRTESRVKFSVPPTALWGSSNWMQH